MMTNSNAILATTIFCLSLFSFAASAGLIFVSGDPTPGAFASDPDNDVFFKNVLQQGTKVVIHEMPGSVAGSTIANNMNDFYNSISGVSSNYLGNDRTLISSDFDGVDLFFTSLTFGALSVDELNLVKDFIANDGTFFLFGLNRGDGDRVNNLLSFLNSNIRLDDSAEIDRGGQFATGSKIASDQFTQGVSSFRWGSTLAVSGGNSLFYTNSTDQAFMAYETLDANSSLTQVNEPSGIFIMLLGLILGNFHNSKKILVRGAGKFKRYALGFSNTKSNTT